MSAITKIDLTKKNRPANVWSDVVNFLSSSFYCNQARLGLEIQMFIYLVAVVRLRLNTMEWLQPGK